MSRRIDKDVVTRSTTGLVFLVVMIFGLLTSPLSELILFAVITLVASYEYARITRVAPSVLYSSIAVLSLILSVLPSSTPALLTLAVACLGVTLLPYGTSPYSYGRGIALRALGLVLIPTAFALLRHCSQEDVTGNLILFFFIFLWTNDTMAYVTGRVFGKHKLWPRISPGKTIEGFVGGVIWASLIGLIFHSYINMGSAEAVGLAALVGLGGTIGDLMESSFKRRAGVKDSGNFMPGHGGMLDRFDGVMIAAPLMYIYIQVLQL